MKRDLREKRHTRIRTRVRGTSARPRVSVYRSLRGFVIQLVDDEHGRTLVEEHTYGKKNLKAAAAIGQQVAKKALKIGITRVVFDRSGYAYHGSVKAIAESLREEGIQM